MAEPDKKLIEETLRKIQLGQVDLRNAVADLRQDMPLKVPAVLDDDLPL